MSTGEMTSILEVSGLELLHTLVAPSLSLSLKHNSCLGGTFFIQWAQAVIWMARPRNTPRGAGPDVAAKQLEYTD